MTLELIGVSDVQSTQEHEILAALKSHVNEASKQLPPARYDRLRHYLTYTSATLSNYITALETESA